MLRRVITMLFRWMAISYTCQNIKRGHFMSFDTLASLGFVADTRQLKDATRDLDNLANKSKSTESSVGVLTKSIGILGAAAATMGLVSSINEVAKFSQSIADLSAITGAAGKDLEYYKKQAEDIGRTTSLSASQAAEAFKLIASAKPDLLASAAALNAVTREAVTLAEATGMALPAAAAALGTSLNQFGLAADKANEVINALAASSKFGTASVASVTDALKNVGSAANSLGVDLTETVAGIQALAAAGREGAEAGTSLRQVMLILEKTGNSALMPSIVGLTGALTELKSLNMSNTQLMEMFGQEAFTSATALLAQVEVVSKLNVQLRGTETATEQARTRMDTFTGDVMALSSAIEGLKIGILGGEVEGLGRSLAQAATSGINAITDKLGALTSAATGAAIVLGGVLATNTAKAAAATYEKIKADIAAVTAMDAVIVADRAKAVASAQATVNEIALAKATQASSAARITSALQQISAEQSLEAVRMKAQISETGRIMTATRMAELGVARVALTAQLTAAETALAATEVRSAAATATLAGATTSLAAAQASATVASRALGAAIAFMTGPWGILLATIGAAAAAFYSYSDAAEDAATANDKLTKSFDRMSSAAKASAYVKVQEELIAIEMKLVNAEAALSSALRASGSNMNGNSGAIAHAVGQVEKLKDEKEKLTSSIDAMNKAFEAGIPAINKSAAAVESLKASSAGADEALSKLSQQTALAKEEFINGEVAATKLSLAFELGLKSASELTPELSKQVEELVKWKNASSEAEKAARKLEEAKKIALRDDENEYDRITRAFEDMEKASIEAEEAEMERIDKAIAQIDKYVGVSEKAAERIEQAFSDAWMNAFDGFESVVDGMKNAFKRMLAEMAHMALTRPIMVSLGMGAMLPAGANAAGTASSLSSGLGLLGGIGGGLVNAGGMIGGAFGGGLAGAGGLIGAGNIGGLFSGAGSLLGSGNIAAGLGMSMPIIAGAVVAAMGINKLTGGGLFGTSYKTTGQDLGLSLGGGNVSGMITTEESKKKSLFRGTSRRTSTSAYDASALDSAFDQITAALGQAANTFGIEGADAIINGFSSSVKINIKDKTEAEIQQAIADWVGSTTTGLVNAVFGSSLDGLQREGEGVIDTVNRLSVNMSAVKSITSSLGLNFELTGKAAMIASTNIVDLAGGIENLAALSSQYYQSFYTDAERQADLQKLLAESFSELNLVIPATREEFRAYVDALDLTTEAGQQAFAALMQLVPGMDQYLTAIESATEAARSAAQAAEAEAIAKAEALKSQGLDLQLRLYDALGQSSEALALRRQLELEATDESLRAMLLSIYAAQDAATAQQELERAQSQAADAARDAANAMQDMIAAAKSAASDAFGKLQESADREKDRLATELDLKLSAIDAERDALKEQRDSVVAGYQQQGKAVEQYLNKLEGLNEVLTGFLSGTGAQANPFKELAMIYTEAKAGLLPDQSRLQSVLSGISGNGSAGFGSAFEQARAMSIARNQASGIQGVVGGQISSQQSLYSSIQSSIVTANEYYENQLAKLDTAAELAQELHDSQVGKIDEQLSEAQKQLNVLLGVDDRLLTIDEALAEFYAAMDSASLLQIDVGMEQIAAINAVESAVVELGAQLFELNKPDDRIWLPPPMDKPMKEGQVISEEAINLLKQIVDASKSNANHSSKSASMLQEMVIGGIDTRVVP